VARDRAAPAKALRDGPAARVADARDSQRDIPRDASGLPVAPAAERPAPWGTIYRWFAVRDGNRHFVRMRWGLLPSWWPKPLKELKAATFNARAETVADKPFFRDAFRRTRCLIPASGYYEWQNTATGKQPWYFTRADGEPITFAGLRDEWKDKATGEALKSCTMLITEPNDFVAEVHDRLPVVIEAKDLASWLNDGGAALFRPAANDVLQRWPVSRRLNSSRAPADDPNLIERIEVR
jgi:putative SOS response-associated peptidase YedK